MCVWWWKKRPNIVENANYISHCRSLNEWEKVYRKMSVNVRTMFVFAFSLWQMFFNSVLLVAFSFFFALCLDFKHEICAALCYRTFAFGKGKKLSDGNSHALLLDARARFSTMFTKRNTCQNFGTHTEFRRCYCCCRDGRSVVVAVVAAVVVMACPCCFLSSAQANGRFSRFSDNIQRQSNICIRYVRVFSLSIYSGYLFG